ncbi:amphiphysin isoform X1 [Lingula anatina]|uniref:Amphiphysin isoform X1 n=2 Tax=Lingula anatina TaxID=7574 RepID=A0A1S3I0K8_LINAN|nr:amphiphysin isoform X1 [Lingula anatina]|eukprot:XP_013391361.1 amphiphysin isoform X1 [Lingula anatina]
MAESKGGSIGKILQKRAARAKEKVLQNLGKADKTTDDLLDGHVERFARQQATAAKLQKELRNYFQAARVMSMASETLSTVLLEIYEDEWSKKNEINECYVSLQIMWKDYVEKLEREVINPLQSYVDRFPEIRTKISKRGRKLVDFDGARHNYQALEQAKKRDETKIYKARQEMEEARRIYEDLNVELHEELPSLYDGRIDQYCTNLLSLSSAEAIFHRECAKIEDDISEHIEQLAKENTKGSFKVERKTTTKRLHGRESSRSSEDASSEEMSRPRPVQKEQRQEKSQSQFHVELSGGDRESNKSVESEGSSSRQNPGEVGPQELAELDRPSSQASDRSSTSKGSKQSESKMNGPSSEREARANGPRQNGSANSTIESEYDTAYEPTLHSDETYEPVNVNRKSHDEDDDQYMELREEPRGLYGVAADDPECYQVPPSNLPLTKLPPGVLYRVQATHIYTGEDVDELTFETGEIIDVVPFDDPEDQDEGWLMGIKQSDKTKGVFPANFTKPI